MACISRGPVSCSTTPAVPLRAVFADCTLCTTIVIANMARLVHVNRISMHARACSVLMDVSLLSYRNVVCVTHVWIAV